MTTETVVAVPRRRKPVRAVPDEHSMSPADAQKLDELARLRAVTRVLRWLSVLMLVTVPFAGGNDVLRTILLAGLALGIPMGVWFERLIDAGTLDGRRMRLVSLGIAFNGFVAILYFGPFSGASMLAVIGLFVVSRVEFLGSAAPIWGLVAGFQAIAAGLVISGAIDDPGLITTTSPPHVQFFMQVFYQVLYAGAYLVGTTARDVQSNAVGRLERAHKEARQREALLHEARQDLDQALNVAVPGRYTEEVVGRFQLGMVIGRGGMAEVYEAVDMTSGEPVAVKLLHPHMLSEPGVVTRFLREARAAAALDSPHVAAIIAASEPTEALPYLVMERLDGRDLADRLRQTPQLPLDEVVALVTQVASVIDLARAEGIVHRDLKPRNLFWAEAADGSGRWKVLDFGVSVLASGSGTLTHGHMVGTPSYMSSEQARGLDVDHRTDIHALAAIAYRCLTGRPPYPGVDVPSIVYRVVHTMPERPSALVDVSRDVDAVLAIGLSKRMDERYDDAAAFAEALAGAARKQLEPKWHRRAARILASHPWGVSLGIGRQPA